MKHAASRNAQISIAAVLTGFRYFFRSILGTTIGQALSKRSDFSNARKERTPLTAIPAPALTEAFETLGHQHLNCSLHLAEPDRVAFLDDVVVIRATAVDAEITTCLSNIRTASTPS